MTANGFRAENKELRAEIARTENTITALRAEVEQKRIWIKRVEEISLRYEANNERLRAALRLWKLIDWDSMTEHDEALFDEARELTRAALGEKP